MQMLNMAGHKLFAGFLVLVGFFMVDVDAQCDQSVAEESGPCLQTFMGAFQTLGGDGSGSSEEAGIKMMTMLCREDVKNALVCLINAINKCPDMSSQLQSVPGMSNLLNSDDTMDMMCRALPELKNGMPCVKTALNQTNPAFTSCILGSGGTSDDQCESFKAMTTCSYQMLKAQCPSVADAYLFGLKFGKPPGCPDVVISGGSNGGSDTGSDTGPCSMANVQKYGQCGMTVMTALAQLPKPSGGQDAGIDSLLYALKHFCGDAKTDLECFLNGYNQCPDVKKTSDASGLTVMLQAHVLKEFLKDGCKDLTKTEAHVSCMETEFKSTQFKTCTESAAKMYPQPEAGKPMSCNLYNAIKTCVEDTAGKNCDMPAADYLVRWSTVMFKLPEGNCITGAAATVLSSVYLLLALLAAIFIL